MESETIRTPFLDFINRVVTIVGLRNGSKIAALATNSITTTANHPQDRYTSHITVHNIQCNTENNTQNNTQAEIVQPVERAHSSGAHSSHLIVQNTPLQHLLASADVGVPGIRTRGVALFMDVQTEKLGMCFFCKGTGNRVVISPGLATLLKGNTHKTSIKRHKIHALPEVTVADCSVRIMQLQNKTVVLFEQSTVTAFAQACSVLSKIGEVQAPGGRPRKISVDAMALGIEKAQVADRYGCLVASNHHEVVVYEDRGEDLSFLKVPKHDKATVSSVASIPSTTSGSERLQSEREETRKAQEQQRSLSIQREQSVTRRHYQAFLHPLTAAQCKPTQLDREVAAAVEFFRKPPRESKQPLTALTRAQRGQVSAPSQILATSPRDHAVNAFLEFQAVVRATREVNLTTCRNILLPVCQSRLNLCMLEAKLEEAEAAIYNNDTAQVIKGTMSGSYMAAYNATGGFVALDEKETQRTGKLKFHTPSGDPIVVTARCTRVMLDDRILDMMQTLSSDSTDEASWGSWEVPKFTWVNGVPGCGKTTLVVGTFEEDKDIVATTTIEAAKDLREKLAHRLSASASTKVRTLASILVNGFREPHSCNRLTVDEALMNHFGAIVMAARLSRAKEVVLIGDINQLPYIDRENLFELNYHRPHRSVNVAKELNCTHRSPMDVVYALKNVYSGLYSSTSRVRSLELKRFADAEIPKDVPKSLYLVHTQEEKRALSTQGYGSGDESRTLTIHEAQGLTFERVMIIQTKPTKLSLHESVPHAVVALSRHTNTCVYYTDNTDDAIGRFMRQAMEATTTQITEHNLRRAMLNRDMAVVRRLLGMPAANTVTSVSDSALCI